MSVSQHCFQQRKRALFDRLVKGLEDDDLQCLLEAIRYNRPPEQRPIIPNWFFPDHLLANYQRIHDDAIVFDGDPTLVWDKFHDWVQRRMGEEMSDRLVELWDEFQEQRKGEE